MLLNCLLRLCLVLISDVGLLISVVIVVGCSSVFMV